MALASINPATGKKIKSYTAHSDKQIDRKINQAHKNFLEWKTTNFSQRSKAMRQAGKILLKNKNIYARLMANEMGKPLPEGVAEVEKCAFVCNFYAANAAGFLKTERIDTDAIKSYVTFEPLGVILAIMPWNFPFWQVFRFLAPGLMAGNGAVLKHASNVSGCALAIENIIKDAGFPAGLFNALLVEGKDTDKVIEHPLVKAVTLTGSVEAGKKVAAKAGSLIKKTVLELGGSDPYVILEDADIEKAAETCVKSRLINNGESCIAAKRFIVVKAVEKEFTDKFVAKMQAKKMGSPLEAETDIGPQARTDLRDQLHQQVLDSIKKGAKCLTGGEIPDGPGAYYPPTVLNKVKKGQPAYDEELFGPVAAIISAKDEAEAIRIANDSSFGLGAAVFTKNKLKGELIAAKELQAGSCFVNALVKSDPRLPFGGINESGYGRELGPFGIKEFVNIKTVYIGKL